MKSEEEQFSMEPLELDSPDQSIWNRARAATRVGNFNCSEGEFTPLIFTLPKARRKPSSTASLRHKSVSKTTKVVFFAAYISHLRRRLKTCF